ncbi:MAG TPA: TetR/AcrR family transcriptional regulator [Verrucomicrobiae bacterium]|jgi:AcrR family transcriptional regulator
MKKRLGDARQAVLESAIKAFSQRGYAGTSVEEILKATGLSKPTLYYYFESKAGLFRAIVAFAYDECHRLMQEAAEEGGSCSKQLTAVTEALFKFTASHENLMRLVLATVFAAPGELPPKCIDPAKRRRNFEGVRAIIAAAQKSGDLTSHYDSIELAHGIFGAISHQIRTHLLDASRPLDRKCAVRTVALFLDGAGK